MNLKMRIVVNKLISIYCIIFILVIVACNHPAIKDNQHSSKALLEQIVQVIYGDLNWVYCPRNIVSADCQCSEAFRYAADSLIIIDSIFHKDRDIGIDGDWEKIAINDEDWESINFYKKLNLSSLSDVKLGPPDFRTSFFLIHQPWEYNGRIFVLVTRNSHSYYEGYQLFFRLDKYEKYYLEEIKPGGFS